MTNCAHHWKQEPGILQAPFVCIRCGAVKEFETSYFELREKQELFHLGRTAGLDEGMPKPRAEETDPKAATRAVHGSAAGASILVIDDEAITALAVKRVLEMNLACRVETASNGREGLAAAARLHPALTLLDIRMPDMDGYEVCRQIKANSKTARTNVVFLSAFPEPGQRPEGTAGYLSKPLDQEILLTTVRELVQAA
ncbi:MAG: response regulator [Dehalococcoidia bacterium]